MISMARKTTNCHSCNCKSEKLIKYSTIPPIKDVYKNGEKLWYLN